uniref:dapper homolog 3-like n=1 Tax=Panthera onca TaxID=9690 RepID=UPI002953679F|nr:dapper homolog 3-like [Panthera onca]
MRRRARQGSPSPRRPPDAPGAARAQRAARPRPRRQESGAAPAPPRARAQRPPRDGTLSPHPHVWLRNVWLAGRHSAGRGRVFPRQVPSSPRPFPGRRPRAAAGPPRFPGLELPARAFPGPGPPALERRGPGTVLDPLTRSSPDPEDPEQSSSDRSHGLISETSSQQGGLILVFKSFHLGAIASFMSC